MVGIVSQAADLTGCRTVHRGCARTPLGRWGRLDGFVGHALRSPISYRVAADVGSGLARAWAGAVRAYPHWAVMGSGRGRGWRIRVVVGVGRL